MPIFFVRHAESLANAGGITMPHAAIPLSDAGRKQAEALAPLLPKHPSAVLISRMIRTRQTAAPYCARVGIAPQEHEALDEFSLIDPALIANMDGKQRRGFVQDYWKNPDPQRRWGENADTFAEFVARVQSFKDQLGNLSASTVIFGHGIWLIMLHWLLQGNPAHSASDMLKFQSYRLAFSMPNCATFKVERTGSSNWAIEATQQTNQPLSTTLTG